MKTAKRRTSWLKFIIIFTVVVCLGVGIGLMFTPMFHVREVQCEGTDRISQEEVLQAAQDAVGKNIFFISLSDITKKIEEIPLAEKVTVKRKLPDKLVITVQETVPAAYIRSGSDCVLCDKNGKILEIVPQEEAQAIYTAYTPAEEAKIPEKAPEKTDQKTEQKNTGDDEDKKSADDEDEEETDEDIEDEDIDEEEIYDEDDDEDDDENGEQSEKKSDGENTQNQENNKQEANNQDARKYEAPLTDGIDLKNPKVGKRIEIEDKTKAEQCIQLFQALDNAGLLRRVTYMDLKNMSAIRLIVEKRLTVEFGDLQDLEYRCSFLAKVINERISAGEEAVLDFRNGNLYVRPPEDGQERVKPRPSAQPKSSGEDRSDSEDEDEYIESEEDEE